MRPDMKTGGRQGLALDNVAISLLWCAPAKTGWRNRRCPLGGRLGADISSLRTDHAAWARGM